MTAIALIATVTAPCSCCGRRFTPTSAQLTAGGGIYCRTTCRVQAQNERVAARKGSSCAACGGPWARMRHYGLEICMPCHGVAWQTCWRKRVLDHDPGLTVAADGVAMRAYDCPLCSFWHQTKDGTQPPQDFLDAQVRLARLFAELSFDIDRYRHRRAAETHTRGVDHD